MKEKTTPGNSRCRESGIVFVVLVCMLAFYGPVTADEVKITAGDAQAGDCFGRVAMDGNYLVAGATGDDDNGENAGSVYVFHYDGVSWIQEAKVIADVDTSGDSFGSAVSISGDYMIVGAPADSGQGYQSGSAYIFHREGTVWSQVARLTHSRGDQWYRFGWSVAISGDYAMIGAIGDGGGSVSVFKREGDLWAWQSRLRPSDLESGDWFGYSISLFADRVIVGAYQGDSTPFGNDAGSAYIFRREGNTWTQEAKIAASDKHFMDHFGASVSIYGDYAIVGAPDAEDDTSGSGAAYIFEREGASWIQQEKLKAAHVKADDAFGFHVAISGEYAAVGSGESNSVYIYRFDGASWFPETMITASDHSEEHLFGYRVVLHQNHVAIGDVSNDENGENAGAVYVYNFRAAMISAPVPGSSLTSTDETFEWNGTGAEKYWLTVGTTLGGNDLYGKDQAENTSAVVSGLPNNGETVYVRLWSKVDGEWLYGSDCMYTAFDADSMIAEIQSPESGTQLSSATVTFAWNDSGAEKYWLTIGTTAGGDDLYTDDQATNTSANVSGLPGNGETVYVRLWSKVAGEWLHGTDYSYTAFNSDSMVAEIQSPESGTVLASTTATFTWNDTGAEKYWLYVGTSPAASDVYSDDLGTGTSAVVSGLPNGGETVYARLWSKVDGEWLHGTDCTYTAFDSGAMVAEIQSPVPGTRFASTTETFTWNDTGAEKYWLWVGTSAGGNELHNRGYTTASATVSGLPNAGETVYVRLWSRIDGEWLYAGDCTYTAAGP